MTASARPHELPIGTVVAHRYQIVRPLGRGLRSQVELVQDQFTDTLLVLKRSLLSDSHWHELQREFQLRRRLEHASVARTRDIQRDESLGCGFITLDYHPGRTLAQWDQDCQSDWIPALLGQTLWSLDYLEHRRVVHGDLKPENLWLRRTLGTPGIMLLDFGYAHDLSVAASSRPELQGGTPAYLDLRAQTTGQVDFRTDQFSVGVTFRDLLAQAAPEFDSNSTIHAVVSRLTHPDPDLRYRSAREALHELNPTQSLQQPRSTRVAFVGQRGPVDELRRELASKSPQRLARVWVGAAGSGKTRLLEQFRTITAEGNHAAVELSLRLQRRSEDIVAAFRQRCTRGDEPKTNGSKAVEPRSQDPAKVIEDLVGSQRATVLIDDLDAADEKVEALLLQVQMRCPSLTWMGCATAWESSKSSGHWEAKPLPPLDDDAITSILEGLGSGPGSRSEQGRSAREIAPFANGNPRVATLLSKTIAQVEGELPSELSCLLEAQIERLSPAELAILMDLACLQVDPTVRWLRHLSGVPREEFQRILEQLESRHLIEATTTVTGGSVRISSEVLRDYLREVDAAPEARHLRILNAYRTRSVARLRPEHLLVHALQAADLFHLKTNAEGVIRDLLRAGRLGLAESLSEQVLGLWSEREATRDCIEDFLAQALVRQGKFQECRRWVEEVLPQRSSPASRVRLLQSWARAESAEGNLSRARALLEQSLEDLPASVLETDGPWIAERLGAVHYQLGDYEPARQAWRDGLATAERGQEPRITADLLNNLGILDTTELKLDAAHERHTQALKLRRQIHDADGESRSLLNLANLALIQGDYDKAHDLYERCLILVQQVGSEPMRATSLANLGMVARFRGNYSDSIAWLEQSMEISSATDPLAEAATRIEYAHVLIDKGSFAAASTTLDLVRTHQDEARVGGLAILPRLYAEARLSYALGDFEAVQQRFLLADSHTDPTTSVHLMRMIYGRALLATGVRQQAVQQLQAALRGFRAQSDRTHAAWCELYLVEAGDAEQSGNTAALDAVIQEAEAMGARPILARAWITRALRASETGAVDLATNDLAQAAELAAEMGDFEARLRASGLKGRLCVARGQPEKAAAWWGMCGSLVLESCPPQLSERQEQCYFEHPERAWVASQLAALLDRRGTSPWKNDSESS